MELQRVSSAPLYLQIKDALTAQIRAGDLQAHQRLPSERELSEVFNVSRMTARQALQALVWDGAAYARVGKGTFVAGPKIDQQLQSLSGFSEDVRQRGGWPSSRVVDARILPAGADAAVALELPLDTLVAMLTRVRLSDGIPLAIEAAYLPAALVPDIFSHDFSVKSLYEVLAADYGLVLTRAEQRIEAVLAGPRELELLELASPAAVLNIQRLSRAGDGTPVEWVVSTYRGDRYAFHSVLSGRDRPDRPLRASDLPQAEIAGQGDAHAHR
jgi:GntR family transcriptional regulator